MALFLGIEILICPKARSISQRWRSMRAYMPHSWTTYTRYKGRRPSYPSRPSFSPSFIRGFFDQFAAGIPPRGEEFRRGQKSACELRATESQTLREIYPSILYSVSSELYLNGNLTRALITKASIVSVELTEEQNCSRKEKQARIEIIYSRRMRNYVCFISPLVANVIDQILCALW